VRVSSTAANSYEVQGASEYHLAELGALPVRRVARAGQLLLLQDSQNHTSYGGELNAIDLHLGVGVEVEDIVPDGVKRLSTFAEH
jgi:hypothetical protein